MGTGAVMVKKRQKQHSNISHIVQWQSIQSLLKPLDSFECATYWNFKSCLTAHHSPSYHGKHQCERPVMNNAFAFQKKERQRKWQNSHVWVNLQRFASKKVGFNSLSVINSWTEFIQAWRNVYLHSGVARGWWIKSAVWRKCGAGSQQLQSAGETQGQCSLNRTKISNQ